MLCLWQEGRMLRVHSQKVSDVDSSAKVDEDNQFLKLTVKIYQAEAITHIHSGLLAQVRHKFSIDAMELLNLFVQVYLGDLTAQTSKFKSTGTFCWNQQIVFVVKFPITVESLIIQIKDDDLMKNNVVGTEIIRLNNISNSNSGGFLPTFGPSYVHLHDLKDANIEDGNFSFRGRLLLSISSEIIHDLLKPYAQVESTVPLPESSVGKEEDFLLFACLRDVMMIDSRIAEQKNIRFSLQFGSEPEQLSSETKHNCLSLYFPNSDTSRKPNKLDNLKDYEEEDYRTAFMTPVKTNKKYYHLLIQEDKPCLFLISTWVDCRRQVFISNILEKLRREINHCADILRDYLEGKVTTQENSAQKQLKSLENCNIYFSKILKENWDMFSSRTQLDIEKMKLYRDILESLECVATAQIETVDRLIITNILGKLENILIEFENIDNYLKSELPEIIIWMESNYKRVGYWKIDSKDILHSLNEVERGIHCGKIQSLFFRSFSKKKYESVLAKADVYLWLGLLKQKTYCLKYLPQGFDLQSNDQETEINLYIPRILNYYKKQSYQLQAHIYQARYSAWSAEHRCPRFVVQILIGSRCRCTQISENTINPTWDETLIFNNLIFHGHIDELKKNSPAIVIEIYDVTTAAKSSCMFREVIKVPYEPHQVPLLKWFNIASVEAEDNSQILAAFEWKPTDEGDGEKIAFDDRFDDFGPVIKIPPSIRPRFSPHRMEILLWGLRELKRVDLMTIEAPRLQIECGSQIIQSCMINNYKKHSNFNKMIEIIDLDLPESEMYFPILIIRLQDCKSFGRRNVLASHTVHSLEKYVVKANGEILEAKFEKQQNEFSRSKQDIAVNVEVTGEPLFNSPFAIQVKIPWNYSKIKITENDDEENEVDWWTRYYISATQMPGETNSNSLLHGTVTKRGRSKTLADLAIGDGKVDVMENLDARAFIIYPCELENVTEFENFEDWLHSFKLTRERRMGRFFHSEKEKTAAILKGCFRIYELPFSPEVIDPFLPAGDNSRGLFYTLPENKPLKVLVRVYIVKAIDLAPSDVTNTTDAYITIQIGNQKFEDKKSYISKQLNPVFGKCFEFVACFPHDSMLHIQVMDWDLMGSDDLIGGTKIDLENRFYSRCRPTCGLPRTYETNGPNAWRDAFSPIEILEMMCQKSGLGVPNVSENDIRIADIHYQFDKNKKISEQDMALYLLHRWKDISPFKHSLVPEHLETRTLYHPSKLGEPRGKLVMWIDMFPENTVPPNPPRDISTRKPTNYELRVIIWNTDDVILADDAFLTGEKMSDIYVKGWLTGKEDSQRTDVHYRSLTGEGNFNWRFIFPFDYLSIERKIIVKKKVSIYSWDETEFKVPGELHLQVWDADYFKKDDCLGELTFPFHQFPRCAKSPEKCCLEMLEDKVPKISLFKQRRIRGWWPVVGSTQNGGKELTGKVEAEFHLLTKDEAMKFPVGSGRKDPESLEEPKRPETSFRNFLHPFKTLRYAFWKRYKRKILYVIFLALFALLFLLFIYAAPGYTAKRIIGA